MTDSELLEKIKAKRMVCDLLMVAAERGFPPEMDVTPQDCDEATLELAALLREANRRGLLDPTFSWMAADWWVQCTHFKNPATGNYDRRRWWKWFGYPIYRVGYFIWNLRWPPK